jgi:hypothetical protein
VFRHALPGCDWCGEWYQGLRLPHPRLGLPLANLLLPLARRFIGLFVLLDYLLLKRRKLQRHKEHKEHKEQKRLGRVIYLCGSQ